MPADGNTPRQDFFPEAREIVAAQVAKRSAHRTGVCWSALSEPPPEVEAVEAVVARLERQAAALAAHRASPRGRFCRAIHDMSQIGYAEEADRLRGIYGRSLSDDRQPLDTAAVGAALTILNGVPGRDARTAIEALSELLLLTVRRAA